MIDFRAEPPITLDEEAHIYYRGSRRIPGVTEILKNGKRTYYAEGSADRGHDVHTLTVMYDGGQILLSDVPDRLRGYIEAWALFREETAFEPRFVEAQGVDRLGRYAGTIDRIGSMRMWTWTIDIKSWNPEPDHKFQLGAYHELRGKQGEKEWTGANKLGLVYLKKDGKYRLKSLDEIETMEAVIGFNKRLGEFLGKGEGYVAQN